MRVSVYDTYVPKDGRTTMHFDILVEESDTVENVYKYGKAYLGEKGIDNYQLTTNECNFCHMEKAPEPVEKAIAENGYFIIEMENC